MIFISLGVLIHSLWQIGAIFVVCYQLVDENEEPGLLVKMYNTTPLELSSSFIVDIDNIPAIEGRVVSLEHKMNIPARYNSKFRNALHRSIRSLNTLSFPPARGRSPRKFLCRPCPKGGDFEPYLDWMVNKFELELLRLFHRNSRSYRYRVQR